MSAVLLVVLHSEYDASAEVDACASAIVTVYTLRIFGLGIFQVHSNTRRRRGSRSLKILEK